MHKKEESHEKTAVFPKWLYAVLCLLYIALCLAASAFYIRVFFWTYVTKLCGRVWLGLTMLFCAAQLLRLLRQSRACSILSMLCAFLICCIPVPAILFWLGLSDGRHTYLWSVDADVVDAVLITPRGALVHLVILLIGAAILYHLWKLPRKSKQP